MKNDITITNNILKCIYDTINIRQLIYSNKKCIFKLKMSNKKNSTSISELSSGLLIIDDINTLSVDKIIDLKDILNNDLETLSDTLIKLKEKIYNIRIVVDQTRKLKISTKYNKANAYGRSDCVTSEVLSESITTLNHGDLINKAFINASFNYLNNIHLLLVLKLEYDIILMKSTMAKVNAVSDKLKEVISYLSNYNNNPFIAGDRVENDWLNFFTEDKFSEKFDKQNIIFNESAKTAYNIMVLNDGKISNTQILKNGDVVNYIYITNNANSIKPSISKIELFNLIIKLINDLYSYNCDLYLINLFNSILGTEILRNKVSIFTLHNQTSPEVVQNFNAFSLNLIEIMKRDNSEAEFIWKNSKNILLEFLFCCDGQNKLDVVLLSFFSKEIYSYTKRVSIYDLLNEGEKNQLP